MLLDAAVGDRPQEFSLVGGGEEVEDARLVLVRPHLAFEHLVEVEVGMVVEPVVDKAFGGLGLVLQFQPDEARQLVHIVDDGGLLAGDDFLITFVGALHFEEELPLLVAEADGLAVEKLGEAGRLEVGRAFEDGLLAAGDGDVVEFVQFQPLLVDEGVRLPVDDMPDAVVMEV